MTNDYGTGVLGVRKDTATNLVSHDGDYAPLEVDSSGKLHVNPGTVTVTATDLDIRNLTATDVVTIDNTVALGQATMANSVPVTFASDQSDLPISDGGNTITVDGTVTADAGTGTFTVDTELPAASAMADGESGTTSVPRIASYNYGLKSDGTGVEDRATLAKLYDLDTGAGTEYVLGVSLRAGGSGTTTSLGDTTSTPLYTRDYKAATYGAGSDPSDYAPVFNFPMVYNSANSKFYYQAAASAGIQSFSTAEGLPAQGVFGKYDASPQAATNNEWGPLCLDGYHDLKINLRRSSDGTEIGTSTSPVYDTILDPQSTKINKIDPMRNLAAVEPVRLVGTDFGGTTKDTNFWTEAVNGAGAAVSQAGEITLTTGAVTAGNYALYTSTRKARYVAGSANFFRGVIYLANISTTKNKRRWGAFTNTTTTPNNGAWFELDEATLYIAYVSNGGTPTRVSTASWNGTAFTLDTNVHTYEIWWTNSKIWYYIDDVLRHTVSASTAVWSYMGAFNVNLQNWNYDASDAGGTATMQCRVASIYRFGHLETAAQYKNITTTTTTVCKYGAGSLHRIVVNLPVNSTFEVYDNTSAAAPAIATVTTSATTNDPVVLDYNVPFNTGLTIKTNGNYNLTVIYE